MKLEGRVICYGKAAGKALVTRQPLSFYGGVDPTTAKIVERGHELAGESIADRVLVFPNGKGSTVGSYILYRLRKEGLGPAAIINRECETIVAVGAIISNIPCVDKIELERISPDAWISIEGAAVQL